MDAWRRSSIIGINLISWGIRLIYSVWVYIKCLRLVTKLYITSWCSIFLIREVMRLDNISCRLMISCRRMMMVCRQYLWNLNKLILSLVWMGVDRLSLKSLVITWLRLCLYCWMNLMMRSVHIVMIIIVKCIKYSLRSLIALDLLWLLIVTITLRHQTVSVIILVILRRLTLRTATHCFVLILTRRHLLKIMIAVHIQMSFG